MSDTVIRVYTPENFAEQIDKMAEAKPDRAIVLGDLVGRHAGTRYEDDEHLKQLGEFVYPAELFADETGTTGLEAADHRLAATGVFPSEYVDETEPAVLSYDEYQDYADDVAGEFRDPIFLVGAWHPGHSYQITGNPENSKPRKCGSMAYPESVFETTQGCAPLNELHLGFPGTVVLEADALDEETVAYARGECHELPVEEREDNRMEAKAINQTLRSLSDGDRVRVNDRDRPLTVVPRAETTQIGVGGYDCVFLSGNGTDYRIKIENGDSQYPELEWRSDREYIGEIEVVERAETTQAEVTA
ncbi:hypothetical protein A6E15_19300 [Natrinema saccharevitans]|uniref:Uncharacterized protein n=1 Tax=Natrinema saccharevitans TaxID=301967 RepID=A0A1S8AR27_9EURY|nr:hypothetical protein [Natrinema saccharevitans]OLZ39112.1 hypothetical protein A6E15_19300 [Natrinema saccharevitans]